MDATLSLKVQRQYNLDAPRMYKAAALVDAHQIRRLPSGNLEAVSQSRRNLYHQINPRYESCTCEDCEKNENFCYHLIAWKLLEAQAQAKPTPRYRNLDEFIAFCQRPYRTELPA